MLGAQPYKGHTDQESGARLTIETPHHEIHEGGSFCVCEAFELDTGVDREYLLVTPDTAKRIHMVISVLGSLDVDMDLYEETTLADGTGITARNRNRNASDSAALVVTHTPTGSGDGNLLAATKIGSAAGGGPLGGAGGEALARAEWLLKQNESYLLRVTSGSDGNRISLSLDWYEHTAGG